MTTKTEAPTDVLPRHAAVARPKLPRFIRMFAIPIVLVWIAIVALLNTVVPQLEEVGKLRAVSMSPNDAPSLIATKHVGEKFQEYDTSSSVMIVVEGDDPLGPDAHTYYDEIVRKLDADTTHVQHVQDFWGDTLTAAGAQSIDGKAAYVQVYIAGDQGEALANESVQAVRDIVDGNQAPPGVKAYVTGPAALTTDQNIVGDASMKTIEGVTIGIIIVMLLIVYRSVTTMLVTMGMVFIGLLSARGIVSFLGFYEVFGLTTFATSMVVTLAIAAATDYAIFLIGRYQEARRSGMDR
ncbi:MMPL family RND transporter, partial [Mycobacterium sp. ITM-2017-0098]